MAGTLTERNIFQGVPFLQADRRELRDQLGTLIPAFLNKIGDLQAKGKVGDWQVNPHSNQALATTYLANGKVDVREFGASEEESGAYERSALLRVQHILSTDAWRRETPSIPEEMLVIDLQDPANPGRSEEFFRLDLSRDEAHIWYYRGFDDEHDGNYHDEAIGLLRLKQILTGIH